MAFTLNGHALLSDEVNALDPGKLSALTDLAADLLGLSEHVDTIAESAARQAKADRAVALQVNYLHVHNHDAEALSEESVDDYRRQYREGSISPQAAALASSVLNEIDRLAASIPSFTVMRSRR